MKHCHVCSEHFEPTCFESEYRLDILPDSLSRRRLKEDAVPYAFLNDLMFSLLAFKKGDIEVLPLPPKPAAANIAPTPRPPKNDLLEMHRSRFNAGN